MHELIDASLKVYFDNKSLQKIFIILAVFFLVIAVLSLLKIIFSGSKEGSEDDDEAGKEVN